MDMPFHHRRLSGPLICVLLNALGLIPVSHAQEDRLKELQARVVSLQTAGNYAEAIDTAKEVLVVAEATYGAEDVRITESLNNLATLYDDPSNKDHGEFGEAEPLLKRVLAIDEKSLGPNHPDVATSLNNLASFYYQQRKYAEAEPLQKRALAIDEKSLGPNHPNVTRDLGYLATLYNSQGRYAEVEPLLKRVLAIDELGPDYPKVAGDLGNLAMFYNSLGEYGESEPLLKRVLAIDEKALGPNHPDVARDLGYLAFAYTNLSKYAEPESLYKRALAIDEKALGPDHPYVAGILNVFATFYMDQSKYAEAEPLYKRSIAIYEKSLGPDHPNVAVVVCNLGVLYYSQQKYGEAESLLKRALAIDEKAPGPDDQNVARDLNDLSNIYTSQGKYAEAEPLLKRAVAAAESTGPDRPGSATFLANLAVLDNAQGKYAEAESLLKRAIPMMEEWLGPDSPYTTQGLTTMAVTYLGEGRPAEAGSSYDKALQSLSGQFRYSFTYMSEKERLQFLGQVENIFPAYFSFCITHSKQDPSLPGKMYDVLLWEKGMVGVSVASLGRQISISGDAQAIKLFEDLTRKKIESARLGTLRPPEWQEKKKVLDSEANNLEAELARRANSTAEQEMLASATWRDVQKKLRPGDAAVEVVRFNFYELFGLAHAVLGLEHFTDKSYYVGLVLTPKSTNGPILVPLGETPNLEGRSLEDYRRFVSAQSAEYSQDAASIPGQALYRAFWSPLERALGGAKTVYLSPDGVLDQVSLGILPAKDGEPLFSTYDLRVVSSTRDLLRSAHVYTTNTAVLTGNPSYDLTNEQYQTALSNLRAPEQTSASAATKILDASFQNLNGLRSEELATEPLPSLPGTAVEIRNIAGILGKQGWLVKTYEDDSALVEAVREVRHPRVLYLATHGFFESDQDINHKDLATGSEPHPGFEDPMLRSGLYFAGADRARERKAIPEALGDGILTAYEASALDLHGTEMVVLSACETGLGKVETGEGVFGLLRGFEEAGADSVVISMWKVPDAQTQQLMTTFYENWLTKNMEKHEALRQAQLTLRGTIKDHFGRDLPYYWGAFVLVGK